VAASIPSLFPLAWVDKGGNGTEPQWRLGRGALSPPEGTYAVIVDGMRHLLGEPLAGFESGQGHR